MRDGDQTGYAPHLVPGVTPEDVVMVHDRHLHCDGQEGVGGLGHPRIFLRIEGAEITCPYCSRTYRLADGAGSEDHH